MFYYAQHDSNTQTTQYVIQGKEFQKIAVVKRFFALLRMTELQNLSCWNEVKHLTRGLVIPSELNDEGSQ